jgi:hypothetical protein
MLDVSVRPTSDKKGIHDFLQVPFALYADDPNWVAPLFLERLDHLNVKKNPYFKHAEAQLFVAYRGALPVGRISAQHDHLRLQHHQDATGQFGFFECEDNPDTAAALIGAAAGWLSSRGLKHLQGPFNFSINDEIGLLVDGFDTPPNMMMGHTLPRYPRLLESNGFRKIKDVIAYQTDDRGDLSPLFRRAVTRALATGDVSIRPLDKKNMARDLAIIMDIFNDAWSQNWGYVPFTSEELKKLGNDLKMLVHGEFAAIASYKGEPAAMAVTLPDLNDWIAGFNGRLLPFNWAKLVGKVIAKRPRSIRMPLLGVRKKYQDSMAGSALALTVIATLRDYHIGRGVRNCEMSWVLEDNTRMRHIIEEMGARPYKTYRVYGKDI